MKKCKIFYQFCNKCVNLDFSGVFVIMKKALKLGNKGKMFNINGLNYNLIKDNLNLYTKRTCSDNSELYITSKLNMLYEQMISSQNHYENRRKLRKMIEKNSELGEIL